MSVAEGVPPHARFSKDYECLGVLLASAAAAAAAAAGNNGSSTAVIDANAVATLLRHNS
jgi:hypothetical protein